MLRCITFPVFADRYEIPDIVLLMWSHSISSHLSHLLIWLHWNERGSVFRLNFKNGNLINRSKKPYLNFCTFKCCIFYAALYPIKYSTNWKFKNLYCTLNIITILYYLYIYSLIMLNGVLTNKEFMHPVQLFLSYDSWLHHA